MTTSNTKTVKTPKFAVDAKKATGLTLNEARAKYQKSNTTANRMAVCNATGRDQVADAIAKMPSGAKKMAQEATSALSAQLAAGTTDSYKKLKRLLNICEAIATQDESILSDCNASVLKAFRSNATMDSKQVRTKTVSARTGRPFAQTQVNNAIGAYVFLGLLEPTDDNAGQWVKNVSSFHYRAVSGANDMKLARGLVKARLDKRLA